ncbi:MAG: hypothetical protein HC924_06735 [Synechococcaceae cyanobacterium SM2_3_2]|nr:hypothetical protein [Synechococcaceae cyanobacterium SM2_3_2]
MTHIYYAPDETVTEYEEKLQQFSELLDALQYAPRRIREEVSDLISIYLEVEDD